MYGDNARRLVKRRLVAPSPAVALRGADAVPATSWADFVDRPTTRYTMAAPLPLRSGWLVASLQHSASYQAAAWRLRAGSTGRRWGSRRPRIRTPSTHVSRLRRMPLRAPPRASVNTSWRGASKHPRSGLGGWRSGYLRCRRSAGAVRSRSASTGRSSAGFFAGWSILGRAWRRGLPASLGFGSCALAVCTSFSLASGLRYKVIPAAGMGLVYAADFVGTYAGEARRPSWAFVGYSCSTEGAATSFLRWSGATVLDQSSLKSGYDWRWAVLDVRVAC